MSEWVRERVIYIDVTQKHVVRIKKRIKAKSHADVEPVPHL